MFILIADIYANLNIILISPKPCPPKFNNTDVKAKPPQQKGIKATSEDRKILRHVQLIRQRIRVKGHINQNWNHSEIIFAIVVNCFKEYSFGI